MSPPRRRVSVRERELEGLSSAERLRMVFEELGPTFVKLAQILSTRPDVLPAEYISELSKLQDNVSPFPFHDARAIIEDQLGCPIAELFACVEEEPAAAASLAQVHRARTLSGDEVAVKVQRAGVEDVIEADIEILRELASLAERHVAESRYFEPLRLVEGFARTIRRELDFVREGRNIERFKAHFAATPTVYIPKVYWDLTSRRVLTTEFVKGIKISELDRLDAAGLDRKAIALNGANLILREIFELRFFHADPHPGNIFVLEGNVIAPVDFGMTGAIDKDTAELIGGVFIAVLEKDIATLTDLLREIGVLEELEDYKDFRLELADLLERYYGLPLEKLDIRAIMGDLMSFIHLYRLRVPPNFAMMGKALLISEGVGRMLYPGFNIIETARPYARKLILQRFDPSKKIEELSRAAGEAYALLKVFPSDMREISSMVRKGKLSIKFEHQGLELLSDELDRSSNRISFALVIAALIVGSSLIFHAGAGPKFLGYPVIGLFGFVLASILGIWLLFGIMRSKRL